MICLGDFKILWEMGWSCYLGIKDDLFDTLFLLCPTSSIIVCEVIFHLTYVGTNVTWIGNFRLCGGINMCWTTHCVQVFELLCMGMCSILPVWKIISYELGMSFVTTKIVTKMSNGLSENEIWECWSLMTYSLDFFGRQQVSRHYRIDIFLILLVPCLCNSRDSDYDN